MLRGIAIMGLNGCGKSTLAHAISKKLNWYEMDVEDYYFPEQKESRQAVLEQQYNVECEYLGELPYSVPRLKTEVEDMIREDIKKYTRFVISGVTMNWKEDILALIDVAFILEVPTAKRVARVQQREEIRFGSRVMSDGDMYGQQKEFRDLIAKKSSQVVEESAKRLTCPKIRLDGTRSIDENVGIIMKIIEKL